MSEFKIWFTIGLEHILDVSGYDHILFVTLLVLGYHFRQWRKLLVLISAFTIGHSISLTLSAASLLNFPQVIIEFLIALSILITVIYQLINYKKTESKNALFLIGVVIFFGLIHGLGFSYLLKSMISKEEAIVWPLLYFNLGLEVGQLVIVLIVVVFSLLLASVFNHSHNAYKPITLCIILFVALKITLERFLQFF